MGRGNYLPESLVEMLPADCLVCQEIRSAYTWHNTCLSATQLNSVQWRQIAYKFLIVWAVKGLISGHGESGQWTTVLECIDCGNAIWLCNGDYSGISYRWLHVASLPTYGRASWIKCAAHTVIDLGCLPSPCLPHSLVYNRWGPPEDSCMTGADARRHLPLWLIEASRFYKCAQSSRDGMITGATMADKLLSTNIVEGGNLLTLIGFDPIIKHKSVDGVE